MAYKNPGGTTKEKLAGRTTRDIRTTEPIWEIIDSWSQQNGFGLVSQDESSRLYQHGNPALSHIGSPPTMVQVAWTGDCYRLQAWLSTPSMSQSMTYYGKMPDECIIDSGGMIAQGPRKGARKRVNKLLQSLGQPLIE
jgi:hypothetical protein